MRYAQARQSTAPAGHAILKKLYLCRKKNYKTRICLHHDKQETHRAIHRVYIKHRQTRERAPRAQAQRLIHRQIQLRTLCLLRGSPRLPFCHQARKQDEKSEAFGKNRPNQRPEPGMERFGHLRKSLQETSTALSDKNNQNIINIH
jgi:hypothetical protein